MRILITAEHYAVASGRYAYDALKRMGHNVRSAGPARGNVIWGMTVDERYTWIPDLPEEGWEPDAVIHMDGNLNLERSGDMPYVVYGVDNHVRQYRQMEWDHLFLAHGHGYRIGEPDVTWLPCGYDPMLCAPGPAWEKRAYDAALIGVMYPERGEVLYGLYQHVPGISIAHGTGAIYDQYAAVYQQARIALVRSVADDVAIRVWEGAGMGCLVLKDANSDDEALGLEHGANCLIYTTAQEAVEQARWALAHPKDAAKIAKAGQQWARSGTWDARLQVIVEWVEAQGKPAQKVVANRDHNTEGSLSL